MNLFEDLNRFGDQVAAVVPNQGSLSYDTLLSRGAKLDHALTDRSLILCLASQTTDFIVGYVAFQRAGHVLLLLNPESNVDQYVELYQPGFLFVPQERVPIESRRTNLVATIGDYQLIYTGHSKHDLHPDLSLLLTTSGSTGNPMLVRQSRENIASNARSIAESLGLSHSDRAFLSLPLNYTYGLSMLHAQLAIGGSFVVNDRPMTDRQFWENLEASEATMMGGVPYSYEMLLRLGLDRLSQTSLRLLTQAGGHLDKARVIQVAAKARELSIDFYVMYGQTEATARMTVLNPSDLPLKAGSIGRPIPGGSLAVVDTETGGSLDAGMTGELVYSGPNVMMGYANSSLDLSKGSELDGTLHTGDVGYRDEDGYFFITGRLKRFVKLFGNRVNLDDVERFLSASGIVAACVGTDKNIWIFVEGAVDLEIAGLQSRVADFLRVHQSAIRSKAIDSLPRSDAGKVQYSDLLQFVTAS